MTTTTHEPSTAGRLAKASPTGSYAAFWAYLV